MEEFCVVIFHVEPKSYGSLSPYSFSSNEPKVEKAVCCF